MVIAGQTLLTMRGVLRVIAVEDNGSGGLGIAGNAVVNKRRREAVEIGAGHAGFEPGQGRGTRQVLRGIERSPLHAPRQQGIVSETIGILAVRIARGEVIDPLGEKVTQGRGQIRRMSPVAHCGGPTFRAAALAVYPAQ
jgi:hypothetical protein